ncbi:MAG: hypothetical protein JO316_21990 [Abitibacteriaceae bacterium]|nr:hypothetical protein [Abditibacteriaceae bacterium]MBV9868037.1 hypothetical protein [Abditibacteriaceae bacterium]
MKPLLPLLFLIVCGLVLDSAGVGKVMPDTDIKQAIADLHSPDQDVRLRGKLTLLRPEYASRLTAFAPQLIASLTDYAKSDSSAIILGLLPLSPALTTKVRAGHETPDKVKARLGDKAAQQRIIEDFQKANDLYAVRKLGADLLYVNTPIAIETFAQRLESPNVFEDVHGNQASLVQILIQCYGEAHPEVPLFSTTEYLKHANVTPEQFQANVHQAYLRKIEAYFRQHYNLSLRINPPLLLNDGIVEVRRRVTQ